MDLNSDVIYLLAWIGQLENIASVSYADLPNVNTFHYTIQKLFSDLLISSEKFLCIGKLSSSLRQLQVFQKFLFLLGSLNFITGKNSVFFTLK